MRISRVSAMTSSIFRNEQQYLHAGDISHNFWRNAKQPFKKKMLSYEDRTAGNVKQKNSQRALGKLTHAYFDEENDLKMRHIMNEMATKLSRISKQQKCLNSYRSSI